MELSLIVKCSCKSSARIQLDDSEFVAGNERDLSESIEQNSEGLFYCSQSYPDRMDINCVMCGNYIKLVY